jgi:pyruvate kinase
VNVAHYVAPRRLGEIQEVPMPIGLSSLGRCEGRVVPNLDAVIAPRP